MKTRKKNMGGKSDTLLFKALIVLVVLILLFFISCKNEPAYYEVRFNSNGGTVYPAQKVREGECVSRVDNPVKEGYTFEGWYTDPKFTYNFDFNQPVYSNLTLYAKWGGSPVPTEPDYLTFTVSSDSVVSVKPSPFWNATTKQYSIDGGETWVDWTSGATPSASSVMFRGLGGSAGSSASDGDHYENWILTGTNVSCSGNIETILDYEAVKSGGHPIMDPYCYCAMFYNCNSLETAPELPATSLTEECYNGMFHGCSLLKTAPELPATTLANGCYRYMFQNCTSLETAPELPATILANSCYFYMFRNCTSLTNVPALPATALADKCYHRMFFDCSSLTTVPALPATSLAEGCYDGMFQNCTSLETAPALPATILAKNCYSRMFSGCTSLTTAPELPATTLADKCYICMFFDCTSLTTVPGFTVEKMGCDSCSNMFDGSGLTDASGITICDTCYDSSIDFFGCCEEMFKDCAALTKAPTLSATQHHDSTSKLNKNGLANRCYFNMFQGCTSLTTAPALPAATLAAYCYSGMFFDCKALTTAPDLPAATLADNCYSSMFNDCKALTTAPELPATTLADNCYLSMFSGCTSLTTAPALPATQHINSTGQAENGLADWCYAYMFYGCTSLKALMVLDGMTSALPATTLADYCYLQMFYGCTSMKVQENSTALPTIIFTCPNPGGDLPIFSVSYMFSGTTGTFTGTPEEGNTYYWYI